MSGVNRVIVVGRTGTDIEIFNAKNGGIVAKAAVATSETWKDAAGNKQEKTEWHKLVFFGRLAEIARDFVTKGMMIYVEGKLETQKYTGNDGIDKYTTQIIVGSMQMLSSKKESGMTQQQASINVQKPMTTTASADIFNDDIPF